MVKLSSMIAYGQIPPLPLKRYGLSANVLHSHDAEATETGLVYTKKKTITLTLLNPPTNTTIRCYFELHSSGVGALAYGRIYKNGSALGTERSTNSTSYVAYTEDLAFSMADALELWSMVQTGGFTAYVRNFRVLGDAVDASSLQNLPLKGTNT